MTFKDDPKLVKLADETISTMRDVFDTPLQYRVVHAKGQLVTGTFTPSKQAATLSKAPIFTKEVPLVMRYSTDTGFKNFKDNEENGSRGFAIRFIETDGEEGSHLDVITNNAFGFIVGTGELFLEQFKAQKENRFDKFLEDNPHAKYFQENQAPAHAYSFATEQWYSTHAFKFVDAKGKETIFRWRIVPWQGVMKYSKDDAAKQTDNYQFDDLEKRLTNGKAFKYRLLAQLAEPNDVTHDSTKVWPETNEFVDMGEIRVEKLWTMKDADFHGFSQKTIFFNPMPHFMDGVEASDDPLIKVRDAVYQTSGHIRRDNKDKEVTQAVR